MRRKFTTCAGLALLVGLGACADLDEQLVSGLGSGYYSTPDGVQAAVNAIYTELRAFWGREESVAVSQFGTDTWTNGDQGGYKHFNTYGPSLNASDDRVRFPWTAFYRGINTANTFLDRAESITGLDPNLRAIRIGEARFLRAFFYFHLVQMYGDVPLPLTETQGVQTEWNRAPAADVYRQIIEDLQAAVTALPATQSEYGRATKGAAQHTLAKVYLTRAYRQYAEQGDFGRAAELAKAVIAGPYSLLPSYAQNFCNPATRPGEACNTAGFNERNSEVVFAVQFSPDEALTPNNTGNFYHLFFLSFYDDRPGLPRSLTYGRGFRRLRPTTFAIGLWDREQDVRFDASYQNVWYATAAATGRGGRPIAVGDTAYWMPGHEVTPEFRDSKAYVIVAPSQYDEFRFPTLRKYQDPTRPQVNEEDSGKDFVWARLAETHLIAAEALLGAGNATEAAEHINKVRLRAAKPGFEQAMTITPVQVTLDFILDERERELSGEINRWFDLVRTNRFLDRVKAHNTLAAPLVAAHHALRPVPQVQIDLTSNQFPQNPGY